MADRGFEGAGKALVSRSLHKRQEVSGKDLEREVEQDTIAISRAIDEPDIDYAALLFSPWERVRAKKAHRARAYLIEALLYLVFVTFFCLFAHTFRSAYTYWIVDSIRRTVVTTPEHPLGGIRTTGDFYDWAEKTLLPGLSQHRWYNNDLMAPTDSKYSAWQNRVIGKFRLRQVRVQANKGCAIPELGFEKFIRDCYPPWASDVELTDPYGPPWNRSLYHWASAGELCDRGSLNLGRGKEQDTRYCSAITRGTNGDLYPESGYVVDFGHDAELNAMQMKALRRGYWVDAHTRAVMVDFTVFNNNVRLIAATRLIVEWFPTGRVTAKASIKPTSVLAQETPKEITLLVVEVLLAFSLALFMLHMFRRFLGYKKTKHENCIVCRRSAIIRTGSGKRYVCNECGYAYNPFRVAKCVRCQMDHSLHTHICWIGFFQDPWNWIDTLNCLLFVGVFAARFALRADISDLRVNDDSRFTLLYPLASQYVATSYVTSFNAVVCFLRAFKYLATWPKLAVIVGTVTQATSEVLSFFTMYGMLFCGFAVAFNLTFGTDIEGFSRFWPSLLRVYQIAHGNFDMDAMEESNVFMAPILFLLYVVTMVLLALPLVFAVVRRTYSTAGDRIAIDKDQFSSSALLLLYNSFKVRFIRLIGRKTPVTLIYVLLENLESVPDLTARQQDDIRTFRNEVEHAPDDNDLFNDVLRAFDRKINRTMDVRDFELFSDTVHAARFRRQQAEEEDRSSESYSGDEELDISEPESEPKEKQSDQDSGSEGESPPQRPDSADERKQTQKPKRSESFVRRAQQSMDEHKLGVISQSIDRMSGLLQSMLASVQEADELRPYREHKPSTLGRNKHHQFAQQHSFSTLGVDGGGSQPRASAWGFLSGHDKRSAGSGAGSQTAASEEDWFAGEHDVGKRGPALAPSLPKEPAPLPPAQ